MPANDNAGAATTGDVRPVVRVSRRRPDVPYATAGNVILPLRFAERMPEWAAVPPGRMPAARAPGTPSGPL
jgi:hypothetical protein